MDNNNVKYRKSALENQIEIYLRKEQLLKSEEYKKLEKSYLMKAGVKKSYALTSLKRAKDFVNEIELLIR